MLERKKGRGGLMAVKVDIEKAYDKVDWKFLLEILKWGVFLTLT